MARTGEKIRAHRILVGKLEGTRTSGSPRNGWDGNIIKDHKQYDRKALTELIWLRTGESG